jgi:cytochrome oxidase assembly protein ShyY1
MARDKNSAPYGWNPGWKLSLFVIFLMPLLLYLGFWQLQRAEEKATLVANQSALREQAAAPLAEQKINSLKRFQPVLLTGEFQAGKDFLLDNQRYQGRIGYELLTPFRLQPDGQLVLVSRGWIAGSVDRQVLPRPSDIAGQVALSGEVYIPLGEPFLLAAQQWSADWPKVIQAVDFELASESVGETLFPYVIRLAPASPGVLDRHWQVVNVPPSKHTAYAVQWFAMAGALLVLYVLAGSGRMGRSRSKQV